MMQTDGGPMGVELSVEGSDIHAERGMDETP